MIKSKQLIFLPSLALGTILAISASSWFSAWLGLEINLMSMAPLLVNKLAPQSVEASIKYFLVQAIASSILIFFVFLFSITQFSYLSQSLELALSLTLLLKAGVAPLHFWFPQVMMCSSWFQCLLILTWQKIAPFILISFLSNFILQFFIVASAVVGVLGGMNQTNIKLILTYSSIIHSAWMLSVITFHDSVWLLYFTCYSFITLSVMHLFITNKINTFGALYSLQLTLFQKIFTFINILSISGMPPFLGFSIKVMAMMTLLIFNFNLPSLLALIASSFLAFYFYLRLTYTTLFLSSHSPLFMSMKIPNTFSWLFLYPLISLMGTFLVPLFFIF